MQCLYCETELRALRGFFDEDFCCREHREKYFSSFRKSFDQMPAHQYEAAEIAIADGEDTPPIAPQFAVSTLETEATTPRVTSDPPEVFVRVFQMVSEAAGEPELNATRMAEFTPLNPEAAGNTRGIIKRAERIEPPALIQFPQASEMPVAELTAESGLIFQIELPDMSAAPHWTGLPLATFAPASQAERAEIRWSAPSPSADAEPQSERVCAETGSLMPAEAVNSPFDARLQLGLPVLAERSHSAILPLSADYCELFLDCHSPESHPAVALQFAPLPIELPGFVAPQEALEIEGEDKAGVEQISAAASEDELPVAGDLSPDAAAVHQAIPEIAPPMAFHSSAVGPTSKTSALVAPPSPLTLPGFASILEPVAPAAAAHMVSGSSLEPTPPDAAASGAEQDAGKPLRLTFGSLVRIKNWKLRITFARSA